MCGSAPHLKNQLFNRLLRFRAILIQACFERAEGDTPLMNDEVAERLTRLESAIAHLEHLTEQLSGVVAGQGRQLEHLSKRFELQAHSLESIELERIRSTDPKPPHYQ